MKRRGRATCAGGEAADRVCWTSCEHNASVRSLVVASAATAVEAATTTAATVKAATTAAKA
jgi:hypothetical protein